MKNNKIEGVQPFNRFFFRSCYYHQLIAGLAAFGIPAESILLSYFVFPRKGFEIEKIVIPEKTLEKVLGYQNKRCNLSKKQLLHNIDKQRPVIVGVDCFHFESRPDTYQKMHDPHYVLVYGYDIDNGTLNVVDHNYRNSWEYSEKIISIGNLLYANKMLRNRPLKRKTTMQILKRCVNKEINDSIILEWYKCDLFQQAKIDSELNLETLKSMVSQSSTVPTTLEVEQALEGALQSKGSKAVYKNADKDTDIEYSLSGNNIKENIVVKEKSAEYRYLFALNTQGLKLRVSEDNESLELYTESVNEDGETKIKTEATIPAPFMYDANGESSDDVYFELAPETDGKYTFAVVASADWINEDGRAFPVIIDPQIVTEGVEYIAKQVKYRTIGTGSSGSYISPWYSTSSSYIKVQRSYSMEYMTTLTIKKSSMEFLNYPISSVKLKLKPYRILTNGYCYINNTLIMLSSLAEKEVAITSTFKNAEGNFNVEIKPYGTNSVNAEFYADSTNGPIIEIEYLINGKVKTIKRQFNLAGGLIGQYNIATGDTALAFEDVSATDSALDFGISHVYKRGNTSSYGKYFRLSLNEKLTKSGAATLDADYVYTDAYGDKHGFKDTYYYIDSLGKKRSISKTSVTVEPDGNLFYIPASSVKYEVKKEQRTETGLTAITKIEGFKGAEWVELRSDELKQIENQIDSIKAVLDTYVKFEPRCITDNGNKLGDLSNYLNLNLSEMNSILEPIEYDTEEKYKAFRNYNKNKELIASNSQATAYLDLVLQKDVLQAVSIPSANGNTDIEDLYKSQAKLVTWKGHLIGIELNSKYCEKARERIEKPDEGEKRRVLQTT